MIRKKSSSALKIIPLGGLHEIGKNTCIFEYDDEIIILDAGLAFPTDGMHGVNIVLPDVTYLYENRHKIKGMIVTHGHEDHIGGIPFHLKNMEIPVIYGPKLAMALLYHKLEEAGVQNRTELKTVCPRDIVKLGRYFIIEYIRNTHSMADSFTVAITTPVGVVIHTGDFKIDHTPVDGEKFDLQKLAEYGEKGVHCLISDSTNSEVPGFTPSEKSVYPSLDRVLSEAAGRVMLTTFASSVHRLQIVLELAKKHGRLVAIVGRSMLNVIAHARNLGYIKCEDSLFVPLHTVRSVPDEKLFILTTGSQGEPMSALTRIAKGEHRQIKIRQGDTVIFSANPIPGNTIAVVNTIDKLMMLGANVVYGKDKGIHVSGHGCQEDQKLMLALTRPKFFIPFHGEHRMLVKHSQTAQGMGVPRENMVVIQNGDVVELTQDSIYVADKVSSGIELLDSSRSGMVEDKILKERQQLAEDGVVTIALAVGLNGKLIGQPQLHLRGVVSSVDKVELQELVIRVLEKELSSYWSEYVNSNGHDNTQVDWSRLQDQLECSVQRMLRREFQGQPLLVFLMQTPDAEGQERETDIKVKPVGRRRRRSTAKVAS